MLTIILFVLFKISAANINIVCNECADYYEKTENCENNYDVLSDMVIKYVLLYSEFKELA